MAYAFDDATRKQLEERHHEVLRGGAGGDPENTKKVERYLRNHAFRVKFEELLKDCGYTDSRYPAIFAVENLIRKGLVEWSVERKPDGSFEWSLRPHQLDDATEALTDAYPCSLPLGADDLIYMNANPYRIAELDAAGKVVGVVSLTGSRYGAAPMPMGMSGWIPPGTYVVQRMVGKNLWLSCDVIRAEGGKIVSVRDLLAEREIQQHHGLSSPSGRAIE